MMENLYARCVRRQSICCAHPGLPPSDSPHLMTAHVATQAYPDMQEIGNYRGEDPLRTDEE